jgi:hypothetical protein
MSQKFKMFINVIPAKAGIQFENKSLDSGFRRNDSILFMRRILNSGY